MTPLLELQGVGRTFAGPVPVVALAEADLAVDHGDHVAVLGPSGSGKSTLLNLLGLLDRPTAGRILIEGVDLSDLDESSRAALRARRIGFVFQSFHLLDDRSAQGNVELPLLYRRLATDERRRRAAAALEAVGLCGRAHARPAVLSGGERQRVAIARAIVTEPALLLCDEPTGNLDSVTRDQVLDVLEGLRARRTALVVITHDPQVAHRARRIVRLHDGRLSEETRDAVRTP